MQYYVVTHILGHELDGIEGFSDDGVEKIALEIGEAESDVERRVLKRRTADSEIFKNDKRNKTGMSEIGFWPNP